MNAYFRIFDLLALEKAHIELSSQMNLICQKRENKFGSGQNSLCFAHFSINFFFQASSIQRGIKEQQSVASCKLQGQLWCGRLFSCCVPGFSLFPTLFQANAETLLNTDVFFKVFCGLCLSKDPSPVMLQKCNTQRQHTNCCTGGRPLIFRLAIPSSSLHLFRGGERNSALLSNSRHGEGRKSLRGLTNLSKGMLQ